MPLDATASDSSVATEGSVGPEKQDEPQPEETPEASDKPDATEAHAGELDVGEILEGEIAPDEEERPDRRLQVSSASFSGPLPPPETLAEYNDVLPGLAREIVEQWKGETGHRHGTVEYLRETDRLTMEAHYRGERRGQYLATVVFAGVIALAIVAIALHSTAIGIAAIVSVGGSAIWAMRRRSSGPDTEPTDLADGDALEKRSE